MIPGCLIIKFTITQNAQYRNHFHNVLCLSEAKGMDINMTVNEYQQKAMQTLNPKLDQKEVLVNSVMGLCGESGEAIDIVKKWLMQGHELDKEHLIKELGDVAWYLAEAATALDTSLDTIFQINLDKLAKRFPNGFDANDSVHREKGDI